MKFLSSSESSQMRVLSDAKNTDLNSQSKIVKPLDELKVVEKVVAYILGRKKGEDELLVFKHDNEFKDAGVQVIAGTVEEFENPEATIIRECFEEAGLKNLQITAKIDEYLIYREELKTFNRRHVFFIESSFDLPNQWSHKIESSGADNGLNFHFYWIPLSKAKGSLAAKLGASVELMEQYLDHNK